MIVPSAKFRSTSARNKVLGGEVIYLNEPSQISIFLLDWSALQGSEDYHKLVKSIFIS